MPITQARMIAILDEAQALHESFISFRDDVQRALSVKHPALSVAAIQIIVDRTVIPSDKHSALEREHFRTRRAKNERNMRYMQRKAQRSTQQRSTQHGNEGEER